MKKKNKTLKFKNFGFVKTIHVQYIEFLFILLILNIIFNIYIHIFFFSKLSIEVH